MYFAVFSLLAVLLVVVCFWREIAPCAAWLAVQHHVSPETLACLYGEHTARGPAPAAQPLDGEHVNIVQLPDDEAEHVAARMQTERRHEANVKTNAGAEASSIR